MFFYFNVSGVSTKSLVDDDLHTKLVQSDSGLGLDSALPSSSPLSPLHHTIPLPSFSLADTATATATATTTATALSDIREVSSKTALVASQPVSEKSLGNGGICEVTGEDEEEVAVDVHTYGGKDTFSDGVTRIVSTSASASGSVVIESKRDDIVVTRHIMCMCIYNPLL